MGRGHYLTERVSGYSCLLRGNQTVKCQAWIIVAAADTKVYRRRLMRVTDLVPVYFLLTIGFERDRYSKLKVPCSRFQTAFSSTVRGRVMRTDYRHERDKPTQIGTCGRHGL